jgi:hypothetical protein
LFHVPELPSPVTVKSRHFLIVTDPGSAFACCDLSVNPDDVPVWADKKAGSSTDNNNVFNVFIEKVFYISVSSVRINKMSLASITIES